MLLSWDYNLMSRGFKPVCLAYVKIVIENLIKLLREEVELLVDTGATLLRYLRRY